MAPAPDGDLFTHIEVGKPFAGHTSYPPGPHYNFDISGHVLRIAAPRLRFREIDDVRRSPCEFAVAVHGPIVFLLYRFGRAIPWSDCPYSWWLVPPEQRQLPARYANGEPHALVTVILIESTDGIVQALRAVTISPALTAALYLAIHQQSETPWVGQDAYQRALDDVYARYPTASALLATARARSAGGR